MAAIDYIGSEKLFAAIQRQKIVGGATVKVGSKTVFHEISEKDELIDALREYFEERQAENGKDQTIYSVFLLDEKLKKTITYNFCLNSPEKVNETPPVRGMDFVNLNIELGELRAKVSHLEEENTRLTLLVNELEEELEENEEENALGDAKNESPLDKVLNRITPDQMDALVGKAVSFFIGGAEKHSIAGLPEDFDKQSIDIVRGLAEYDPKIHEHLGKILTTAKENKVVFDMIITQIDEKL